MDPSRTRMLHIAFKDVTVLCWELEHQKSPTWSDLPLQLYHFSFPFPTQGLKHLCISAKPSPP